MNKQFSKKFLQFKEIRPISSAIKPNLQDQILLNKNTSRPSINNIKRNEIITSARFPITPNKVHVLHNEETIKKDSMSFIREKQNGAKLRQIINHKDQLILSKNLKIKQLELEKTLLKSQLDKYRMQIHQLAITLEEHQRNKCEMAHTLFENGLTSEEDEERDQDYPNLDIMSYEELLELENKIGYVSKGLQPDIIDKIPLMTFIKVENDSKDSKCLICQYDFEENNTLRIVQCGHLFHKDCIDKWLLNEKICPNCKREV